MAAFSNFHFFLSSALSRHASVLPTRRGFDRIANYFAAAARVAAAAGEIGLLLWMVLALAFSLLVMAGFFV
jgi:hypothetical protein